MVTFVSPGGAAGVLFTPVTFNSALTPLRPPLVSTTRPKGRGTPTQGSAGLRGGDRAWKTRDGGGGGEGGRVWREQELVCVWGGSREGDAGV